jgi:hypothetical protein
LVQNESVTVTGKNFAPARNILVAECDANAGAGTSCDTDTTGPGSFKSVTTSASGTFSTTFQVVRDSAYFNCFAKGTQCAIQTVNTSPMSDRTQDTSLNIYFKGQKTTPKPKPKPTPAPSTSGSKTKVKLSANKSTHLTDGQSITVMGTGYLPNRSYFLAECDANVDAGGNCNMKQFKQVRSDAKGRFTQQMIVSASWEVVQGEITHCSDPKVDCALQTSDVANPRDRSQEGYLALSFGGAVSSAPNNTPVTGLSWMVPLIASVLLLAGIGAARLRRRPGPTG